MRDKLSEQILIYRLLSIDAGASDYRGLMLEAVFWYFDGSDKKRRRKQIVLLLKTREDC